MSADTRPHEQVQHSWEHMGKFILERFGKEAYEDYMKTVAGYYDGERRPHKCGPACRWTRVEK